MMQSIIRGLASTTGLAVALSATAIQCETGTRLDRDTSKSIYLHANDFRAGAGRKPLKRYASLDDAARLYARFLCESDQFDHVTEQGFDVLDRVRLHARDLFYSRVGENLYRLRSRSGALIAFDLAVAEEKGRKIEEGWENSPGHRKNLLRSDYNGLGVGIAYARDRLVGVQVFARVVGRLAAELPMNHRLMESTPLHVTFEVPVATGTQVCLAQSAADPKRDEDEVVAGCGLVKDWSLRIGLRTRRVGLSNLKIYSEEGLTAWGPRFVGVD